MKIGAYWAECNNFGDKLTVAILNSMSGIEVYKEEKQYAKFVGVGSILERFQGKAGPCFLNPLYVFGTGYDWRNVRCNSFSRKLKVYAVRGMETQKYIENITGEKLSDIVLGDIGLLAGRLAKGMKIDKLYDIGIVPHYVDKKDARFKELQNRLPNAKILNVRSNPKEFIKELLKCKRIVSTAMHPLIVCDALRIPNLWAYLPNANQVDMSKKFDDYYSAFGLKKEPLILDEQGLQCDLINLIEDRYDITDDMIDKKVYELQNALIRMLDDMKKDYVSDILWKGIKGLNNSFSQMRKFCFQGGERCGFGEMQRGVSAFLSKPDNGKRNQKEKYAKRGKNVQIIDESDIHYKENIKLGNNVYIGREASIWGIGGVTIGDNTILGPRVTIHSSNHRYENAEMLPYDNVSYLQEVQIGRNVWIGDSAMLCPGCEIGDGAVVAMGAVVSGKVPKCAVVAGNPAKVVKMRDEERYERLDRAGQYYLKEKRRAHLKPKYVEKNDKKG